MRSTLLRFLAAGCLLSQSTTLPAQPAEPATPNYAVRMLGSSEVAELMGPIIVEFLKAEGWLLVDLRPAKEGGAFYVLGRPPGEIKLSAVYLEPADPETAIAALGQGFADIAMSSRRATEAETGKLASLGNLRSPDCEHAVATDGLTVIVHANNPIESLSAGQLRSIFTRKTTAWEELGSSGAIHLYVRDEKSGTNLTFQSTLMANDAIHPDAMRYNTDREVAKVVSEDPRGIGLVGLPFVGKNKALGIAGADAGSKPVKPGAAEVQSGAYPLSRKLYLYTAAAPSNPLVAKLVKFATSAAGEAISVKSGYLSTKAPSPTPPPAAVTTPAPTAAPEVAAPKPTPTPRPRPTPRPARERDDEEPAPKARPTPTPKPEPTPRLEPTPTRRPSRYLP